MEIENTERKSKGNTILLTVIGIATLLVAMVGATFAYFTATINSSNTSSSVQIQTATVAVSYDNGASVNVTGLMPGGTITDKVITIGNATSYPAQITLRWATGVSNTFTRPQDLTYSISCTGTGAPSLTSTQMPATNAATPTAIAGFTDITLAASTTYTCTVSFVYAAEELNQNADQGKSFTGNFELVADRLD